MITVHVEANRATAARLSVLIACFVRISVVIYLEREPPSGIETRERRIYCQCLATLKKEQKNPNVFKTNTNDREFPD